MSNWLVCENPHDAGYREFELVYQEHFETLAKRFLRVWDDGRVEVGTRNSPFTVEWSKQVVYEETQLLHNLGRAREILKGI